LIWEFYRMTSVLTKHLGKDSCFSPSLKRSAESLIEACHDAGLPHGIEGIIAVMNSDSNAEVQPWKINTVSQKNQRILKRSYPTSCQDLQFMRYLNLEFTPCMI
jgi:hypothetical protein